MNFQFIVDSVDCSSTFETLLAVKKNRYFPFFRSTTNNNVNISYIDNPTITSSDLNIIKFSENSSIDSEVATGYIGKINSVYGNLSITDQFVDDIPLFYKHSLKQHTSQTVSNVLFLDREFNIYSTSEYVLEEGYVYNNISVDNPYLIQYCLTVSGVTSVYTELLDNKPVCSEVSFEDLDESGSIINPQKYILTKKTSFFEYAFSSVANRSWKKNSSVLEIANIGVSNNSSWRVQIQKGDFIDSRTIGASTKYYRYYIPEFSSQTFDPIYPYRKIQNEDSKIQSSYIVKTKRGIATNKTVSVLVYNQSTLLYAITNNSLILGGACSGNILWTNNIVSLNSHGFIHLNIKLENTYRVVCAYSTDDEIYVDNRIDFNLRTNLSIANQRIVFYLNPETTISGPLSVSIQYLILDDVGRITQCSQFTGLDSATVKLREDFDTTGSPLHDFYFNIESTVSGLESRVSGVNLSNLDEFSFIDKYTIDSCLFNVSSGLLGSGTMYENYLENPCFYLLGLISLPETFFQEVYDCRVPGGGLFNVEDAIQKQREVMWYSNLEKITYPGMNSVYITIPRNSFLDNSVDEGSVRTVFEKWAAAAGYAVIRPYGIDPIITNYFAGTTDITLYWPTNGVGQTYTVYYSVDRVIWNEVECTDLGVENNINISGLQSATKYYFYITANGNNGEHPGPVVSIQTEV